MTYDKPEVVMLGGTIREVQGFGHKPLDIWLDRNRTSPYFFMCTATISAYEADE